MSAIHQQAVAWLRLLLGAGLLYAFCFWLVPAICQHPAIRPLIEYIEAEDLDAGALFYTESPVTGAVEFYWQKEGIIEKTQNED